MTAGAESAAILRLEQSVQVVFAMPDDQRRRFADMMPRVVLWGRDEERPTLIGFPQA